MIFLMLSQQLYSQDRAETINVDLKKKLTKTMFIG
jgi:hypothetical protein